MKTDYQFLLVSSPPAKEHAFQKAKAQYGSTYAFQSVIIVGVILVVYHSCEQWLFH